MCGERKLMYEPADISIYLRDKGLVLRERSLLAYDRTDGKILAFGTQAGQLQVDPRGNTVVCSPLRQGIVADHTAAVRLFACLLQKALGKKPLRKPGVVLCVPRGLTAVEARAAEDTLLQAGAREVILSELSPEQLIRGKPDRLPKRLQNRGVIVSIATEDPEGYIREQLFHTLRFAARAGVSAGRVAELLDMEASRPEAGRVSPSPLS